MFIGRSPNWCEVNVVAREKERKEERESENEKARTRKRERERSDLMHGLQHMTASTIPPVLSSAWPCGTPLRTQGGSDFHQSVPITLPVSGDGAAPLGTCCRPWAKVSGSGGKFMDNQHVTVRSGRRERDGRRGKICNPNNVFLAIASRAKEMCVIIGNRRTFARGGRSKGDQVWAHLATAPRLMSDLC